MNISTVIFDLNEVSLNGLKSVHAPLDEKFGKHPAESWSAFNRNGLEEYFCGVITEDALLQRVLADTGWDISLPDLKQFIRNCFSEIEGTRAIIQALKARDYKLGLLSDHGRDWAEYCEDKFSHHHLYDCVVYSYEVGTTKNNVRVFRHILKRLESQPGETIFIDDRPVIIEVAQAAGLHTILFTSPDKLAVSLNSFGIYL